MATSTLATNKNLRIKKAIFKSNEQYKNPSPPLSSPRLKLKPKPRWKKMKVMMTNAAPKKMETIARMTVMTRKFSPRSSLREEEEEEEDDLAVIDNFHI